MYNVQPGNPSEPQGDPDTGAQVEICIFGALQGANGPYPNASGNQFVRVTRRTKRQREKANSPVVQVVQLESPLERLSDCRTVPYLRFFLVRNEEAGGSNPLSSTRF
jgi:hypothetical protein